MNRRIVPGFAMPCLFHCDSAGGGAPSVAVGWNPGDTGGGDFDGDGRHDETFHVELDSAQKAPIADGSGLATVLNDD